MRELSWFAGCDYFRLASNPQIQRAVNEGLKRYGLNVAASRATTGNHPLYKELEAALARFFGAPAALLTPTGYAANAIAAQAMNGDFTHVLLDAGAHVSLRDATRFLSGQVLPFRSRDPAGLRRVLNKAGPRARPLLLTDGVFTHEGEVAPLRDYLKILRPFGARARILLDDAHGAGVLGRTGRGTIEYAAVSRQKIVQTITLSKAFGVYGGAVICSRELREKMFARGAAFIGSTPLPLPLAHAALRAVRLLEKKPGFLQRLNRNVVYLKTALRDAGLAVPMTPVPVIAFKPRTAAQAAALQRGLLRRGIYPSFVKYPGGPVPGYFRWVISSEHSRRQLDGLLTGVLESLRA